MPARPTREGRSTASAVTGRPCGEPPHNTLPGWQQRCSLPAGAHLMQAGAGEVELREGGPVVIRHIRPAAEEDQGVGVADQRPHVHFDVGLLLGRRMVTGIPARAGRKSPSQSFLESWAPPAHGSASCKSLGGAFYRPLTSQPSDSAFLLSLPWRTLPALTLCQAPGWAPDKCCMTSCLSTLVG